MEENKVQENKSKEKKGNGWKIIAILLLLISLTEGYFLFHQNKQIQYVTVTKNDLVTEKAKLEGDLNDMLGKYNDMKTNNADMQAKIDSQKVKIVALLEEAKKHKDDGWIIYKLRKETKQLRTIMQGYVSTIDSLNTANQRLIKEKNQVTQALQTQQSENKDLQKTNEGLTSQVTIASQLKITQIEAYGLRVKRNNTGKKVDRAKKTERIKACFTIADNKITKSGNKWLYMRIMAPDGHVLSESGTAGNMFRFNGVSGLYSVKKQIDYENKQMQLCMEWKNSQTYSPGEYNVVIYADSTDIGRTKFTLK